MSDVSKSRILELLSSDGSSAAKMTHNLSQLGDGNMAKGMIALWKDGQRNGFTKGIAVTTIGFTVVLGIRELVKSNISEMQTKQAIKDLFTPHKSSEDLTKESPASESKITQQTEDIYIDTCEPK